MRLRMADGDRERYGGPEELDFAAVPAWLDDLGYDELVALDDQIIAELGPENPLMWVVYQLITDRRARGAMRIRRVWVWLSLRAAGVDLPLAEFKPAHLFGMRVVTDRDAVPPAGAADSSPTSSPESAEVELSIPTSESSTGASTPGPGASTA
jgi:hypothetical protein